jgi:hypothetical protein
MMVPRRCTSGRKACATAKIRREMPEIVGASGSPGPASGVFEGCPVTQPLASSLQLGAPGHA